MVDDRVDTDERNVTGHHYVTSELGLIYNINKKYGIGFTNFIGADLNYDLRGGFELRLRKWFNKKTCLDLSAGAILWGVINEDLKYKTFIGGIRMYFNDWMGFNILVEELETKSYYYSYFDPFLGVQTREISHRKRNIGVYLGYQLSSKPGLIVNGIAVVATLAVMIITLATSQITLAPSF